MVIWLLVGPFMDISFSVDQVKHGLYGAVEQHQIQQPLNSSCTVLSQTHI